MRKHRAGGVLIRPYRDVEKIEVGRIYTPLEAVRLAKETSTTSYPSTVEVAFRLGVDPRKADQMVRGTVNLPNGTGKTARVIVFAVGERAEQARAAGADEVGGDELIEKLTLLMLAPGASWTKLRGLRTAPAPIAKLRGNWFNWSRPTVVDRPPAPQPTSASLLSGHYCKIGAQSAPSIRWAE